jgi:hypothetical protein
MNTERRVTRNSGKFSSLSEDTIFFVASGADIVRWRLTGVSSSLVDRGDSVHATHSKEDILIEVKNTWSFSLICTHEPWKCRSNMPQRMAFLFPIDGPFAYRVLFFACCHELAVECTQRTYGRRPLAREHTEHVRTLRMLKV